MTRKGLLVERRGVSAIARELRMRACAGGGSRGWDVRERRVVVVNADEMLFFVCIVTS